jgi:two-component system sensor histidine kinase/response regulator
MGNEGLYRRLLEGFRDAEIKFIAVVKSAMAELRWADALRRSHDMKGLAGTIGAHRLHAAARDLQAALAAQRVDEAMATIERVDAELRPVLAEIEILMQGH